MIFITNSETGVALRRLPHGPARVTMKTVSNKIVPEIGETVTDQPFHLALCRTGPCAADHGLLGRLRAAVGRSRYGVLISTGCLLGAPRCQHAAGPDSGPVVVVQPSDREGRAHAPAIIVGPILTARDVESVGAWLEEGVLDPARLDPHLRYAYGRALPGRVVRRPAE
jgi:hypothetical protein